MGWENRNGRLYYYKKRRVGRQVISEYSGSGYLALLSAEWAETEREQAGLDRESERQELQGRLELDREINQALDTCSRLAKLALILAGYHSHKGQWRRYGTGRNTG